MNKTLAAATLSTLMTAAATTAANDDTSIYVITKKPYTANAAPIQQPTPADECLDKVFTSLRAHFNQKFDDSITRLETRYSEDQVEAIRYTCEVATDSPVTAASDQYLKQDGYDLVVR